MGNGRRLQQTGPRREADLEASSEIAIIQDGQPLRARHRDANGAGIRPGGERQAVGEGRRGKRIPGDDQEGSVDSGIDGRKQHAGILIEIREPPLLIGAAKRVHMPRQCVAGRHSGVRIGAGKLDGDLAGRQHQRAGGEVGARPIAVEDGGRVLTSVFFEAEWRRGGDGDGGEAFQHKRQQQESAEMEHRMHKGIRVAKPGSLEFRVLNCNRIG